MGAGSCTITPSGDFRRDNERQKSYASGVLAVLGGNGMLEWNPKLVALVVGIASAVAAFGGWTFGPINFNWGLW